MKSFCVILLFGAISTVCPAPANVSSLYNIVKSDSRTKQLQQRPFIKECRLESKTSSSLCLALYDVALTFNSKNWSFYIVNATFEEGTFCQTLNQVLPDSPANNDSSINFKDVQWFKDVAPEECEKKCLYTDPNTYDDEKTLKPVCRFLLNQYSFLYNNQSKAQSVETQQSKQNEANPAEIVETSKSAEKALEKSSESSAKDLAQAQPIAAGYKSDVVSTESSSLQKLSNEEIVAKVSVEASNLSNESIATQASSAVVVSGENIKESASEVERKPLAQTSPATTTLKVVPQTPKATTKVITKIPDEVEKIDDQLKPDVDEDDQLKPEEVNLEDNDKLPFDEPANEASEIPEKDIDQKTDLDYQTGDDDDDEYDPMARNNNLVPDVVVNKMPQAPVADEVDSQRLEGNDPQTKIKQVAFEEDPDSNFFAYLCSVMFLCVFLYILHQNRQKLLALCLEGRRGNRRSSRSRGGSKAAYSKLDCNLEEAITSTKSMSGKSLDVIY